MKLYKVLDNKEELLEGRVKTVTTEEFLLPENPQHALSKIS